MGTCIVCGSDRVQCFLDLGTTALANKFLSQEDLAAPEPKYPLAVGFCHECSHVQLMAHVPPSLMFENYLYMSSVSDTLKNHLHGLALIIAERNRLTGEDLVVDIGCNDGSLLSAFKRGGARILGVDPAANLAGMARRQGIEVLTAYFNSATAEHIVKRMGKASVITATNTFPHIPDLNDFVRGIQSLLTPEGVFVIEMHYLQDLLEQGAFDTIYHEHVSYWSLRPIIRLLSQHGLQVADVERLPLHHGQLRVFIKHRKHDTVQPSVAAVVQQEIEQGLDRFETYRLFAEESYRIKREVIKTLDELIAQGKRIAAYGAPAKGNTLLSFLEIGPERIQYIADRSPLKQGLYTPGMHIPIVHPDQLLHDQPDYVLLLAWNFAEEIMAQQEEYRRRGGRFIIPVPYVRIL